MNKFTLQENSFLGKCTQGYYSKDYIGYQQPNNPDFINHLKNMTKAKNELELVHDFVVAYETAYTAIKEIIQSESLLNCVITVVPRSKNRKQLCTIAKNVSQGNILRCGPIKANECDRSLQARQEYTDHSLLANGKQYRRFTISWYHKRYLRDKRVVFLWERRHFGR